MESSESKNTGIHTTLTESKNPLICISQGKGEANGSFWEGVDSSTLPWST